jgi:hypothetical protein
MATFPPSSPSKAFVPPLTAACPSQLTTAELLPSRTAGISADLLHSRMVFVRCDGVRPPLVSAYDGPFQVLQRSPHSFRLQIGDKSDVRYPPEGRFSAARCCPRLSPMPRPTATANFIAFGTGTGSYYGSGSISCPLSHSHFPASSPSPYLFPLPPLAGQLAAAASQIVSSCLLSLTVWGGGGVADVYK